MTTRAGDIEGTYNSIIVCKLQKPGETIEEALVRVGEDDQITMDEAVRFLHPVKISVKEGQQEEKAA